MRKVVDSNYLQCPELRQYLERSSENIAVLTDYASMEAYKGDTLTSIYKSMAILSEFPHQTEILKNTSVACGLSGRRTGLQRRLVDHPQTKGFGQYCQQLAEAKAGDPRYERQLLEMGRDATKQLNRMLSDAQAFSGAIDDIAKTYTAEELRIVRSGIPYSRTFGQKLITHVFHLAATLFVRHPMVQRWPVARELPNTLIFRISLCAYLLALEWISVGGVAATKPTRIRNDMVDVNFAAYATYFDGLLSKDQKVQRIHRDARFILENIFDCSISTVRKLKCDA